MQVDRKVRNYMHPLASSNFEIIYVVLKNRRNPLKSSLDCPLVKGVKKGKMNYYPSCFFFSCQHL